MNGRRGYGSPVDSTPTSTPTSTPASTSFWIWYYLRHYDKTLIFLMTISFLSTPSSEQESNCMKNIKEYENKCRIIIKRKWYFFLQHYFLYIIQDILCREHLISFASVSSFVKVPPGKSSKRAQKEDSSWVPEIFHYIYYFTWFSLRSFIELRHGKRDSVFRFRIQMAMRWGRVSRDSQLTWVIQINGRRRHHSNPYEYLLRVSFSDPSQWFDRQKLLKSSKISRKEMSSHHQNEMLLFVPLSIQSNCNSCFALQVYISCK